MQATSNGTPSQPTVAECLEWAQGVVTAFPFDAVHELFAQRMRKTPGAIAVREGEQALTYAQLAALAGALAKNLREVWGGEPGLVAVPAVHHHAFVIAILGILQAGGAYLPVDEGEPAARQQHKKNACDLMVRWEEEASGNLRFQVTPLKARGTATMPKRGSAGEQPAYVLYTSGSTGVPKGVVVPHRAIARLVCQTDYLQLQPDDVVAFHSNPCFDASTLELWGPLLNGGTVVITPREVVLSARELGAHLGRYGITTLWLTMSLLAQLSEEDATIFAGLRHLLFGGESADAATLRRIIERGRPGAMINGYGPTECTTFAVCQRLSEGPLEEPVPIGRPIANTTAYVLDEAGEPAMEGELYVGGPGLALEYLEQPELTAERFVETRWGRLYRTGDRVRWRADGRLDYFGRLDRQVKIRGFRIEPGEVEAALRQVPGVSRGAVVPRARPSGEPALVGYYTGEAAPEAVRAALSQTLPAQMVPSRFVLLASLPLTPNGKLDERALPDPWVGAPGQPAAPTVTATLEETIAAAWREVLGLERVGFAENFFELGGTSLSLLRVFRRLRERPECNHLRVVHLFNHPTIMALTQHLRGARPGWTPAAATARAEKARAGMARRRLLSDK